MMEWELFTLYHLKEKKRPVPRVDTFPNQIRLNLTGEFKIKAKVGNLSSSARHVDEELVIFRFILSIKGYVPDWDHDLLD